MNIGLDIGRQVVKLVALEKSKTGYKVVKTSQRFIPDQNRPYDPEKIDLPIRVIAIKELLRQIGIKPKRLKNLITGISGTNASVKQITTMEMEKNELDSSMNFEARKHIPMDGTDAVIDYQILGPNRNEVDKIDVALIAPFISPFLCWIIISFSHLYVLLLLLLGYQNTCSIAL